MGKLLLSRKISYEKLFLNVIAVFGAVLGLLNAALSWRIFGTSDRADVWILSLVIVQAFILLSQLGVEQVAVFSAEAYSKDRVKGEIFDRDSLTWSLIFGLLFSALLFLARDMISAGFGAGYNKLAQSEVGRTMAPLLLQVAVSPCLYVLKQQLLLKGRTRLAVSLNNCFGGVQCIFLVAGLTMENITPYQLTWSIGIGSALVVVAVVYFAGPHGATRVMPDWKSLVPFVRSSVQFRFVHAIHNFMVVFLTNSVLSGGVVGTISIFQYTKKIADGLASIAVGPHLSIYHAVQARAWVAQDKVNFVKNIKEYIFSAIPLLLGASLLFFVGVYVCVEYFNVALQMNVNAALFLLALLLSWQLVISIESVAAGVLVLAKNSVLFLLINGLYVGLFFSCITFILDKPYTGSSVAILSLSCQVASFLLFSAAAKILSVRHFGEVDCARN